MIPARSVRGRNGRDGLALFPQWPSSRLLVVMFLAKMMEGVTPDDGWSLANSSGRFLAMTAIPTTRCSRLASRILYIGAGIYALLCLPAVGRHSNLGIDPFWLGVTYLWIAPVCLSALFDSLRWRARRGDLMLFALLTALFHAGTVDKVQPRNISVLAMLTMTGFFAPIHLLGVFAADALMQVVLLPVRRLRDAAEDPRFLPQPRWAWIAGGLIVCLAVVFAVMYRSHYISLDRERGLSVADREWAAGEACVYGQRFQFSADLRMVYSVDPDTGLPRRERWYDWGATDAYNARIAELIRLYGLPPDSLKEFVPSAEQLAAWFDSDDLAEIPAFPHQLTPDIVVTNRGFTGQAGKTFAYDQMMMTISTPGGSEIPSAGDGLPVFGKVNDPILILRHGDKWVGVFHKDGREIVSAFRR